MAKIATYNEQIEKILSNIQKVIVGKDEVATLSLVALLAEGHVLLEDVPGVGKTMLVRAIAKSIDCDFKRIQFTPDLLPSDITGMSIYNPKELKFEFRPGPILGNVVLADEINRTSPKTQSALLEAMEENSVTVDGRTIEIGTPFFVMATQNPIEYEGTYPLPEAQLDRFILMLNMGYPSMTDELEMLQRMGKTHPIDRIQSVLKREDIIKIQKEVKEVHISENVQKYILGIVGATRNHEDLFLGASPRASIALMQASKALAYIRNRDFVLPDDIQYLASAVLAHRLILTTEANYQGKKGEDIIEEIVEGIPVPIRKEE